MGLKEWKCCYKEKQLIHKVRECKRVIIYGAGMVGELVFRYLSMCDLKDHVLGFAVSRRDNRDEQVFLQGIPVYGIDEWEEEKENALVIVATLPDLHKEMGRRAEQIGFEHVMFVTEELYGELSHSYMKDYRKRAPLAFPPATQTRILFMASDNSKVSGAFLCMTELCAELKKHGIGTAVVLPHYGTGAAWLEEKGISYTYIESRDWACKIDETETLWKKWKFGAGLLFNYRAKAELISLIKEQRVDLVHCNTTYTYIGAAAAKQCGVPFVWHLRENLDFQGYRIFWKRKALKLMEEAGKVITVSWYIKDLYPFEKEGLLDVLYDAVDIKEECPEREIFCGETVRMIQVGLLIEYKGQKELIEACHILKEKGGIDFHLLIVGKGLPDYVEELHQLVDRYGLKEMITFYGASSDVGSLYAQSDISFMCSGREAYGRVTIESQLSGCLVIGVDSGATPELIEDQKTGYLYQAGNAGDLAEKILEAAAHVEKSREIAAKGQNYARRTYTKENSMRQMKGIYEEVLGRKIEG